MSPSHLTGPLELALATAMVVIAIQWLLARRGATALRESQDRQRRSAAPEPLPAIPERTGSDQTHDAVTDAVARVAGDIAHDLNNLLAGIAGRSELLMTRVEPAHPARQEAVQIRDAALSGARLTRRLRTLGGAGVTEPGQRTSLLVVEDEPHVREFVRAVLSRAGHDVIAVAGPHEALSAMKRQPSIELLLVDVVIPHMSGYDLAAQARLLVPGVRIVFMSGFACDETRRLPSDGFLPKPFDAESLQAAVQKALVM